MINIRKTTDRGHFNHGWLETFHTFAFGDYHNAAFMGFRSLRVINEDTVAPKTGFPTHFHRDMEILTYLLDGSLAHKDCMGNGSTIKPGEIQYMSAGRGVEHSEFNPDDLKSCHLLQIWIMPSERGMPPRYSQQKFDTSVHNQWQLLASREGREGSIAIRQAVDLFRLALDADKEVSFSPQAERGQWIQLTSGSLSVNGTKLSPGDGAAVENENKLVFKASQKSECLVFDLI